MATATQLESITNSQDLIDIRDVIDRLEYLESETDRDECDTEELSQLKALIEECRGNGGDHEYDGSWFPVTLIRDSYFDESFAEEEAESCGLIVKDAYWPNNCIDWTTAYEQLQQDYTTVEFDGVTYWVR